MTAAALDDGVRLDVELVRRGLVRSRRRAVELVAEGKVTVGGAPARKPSQHVGVDDDLAVHAGHEYVSRAAHKLLGALDDVEVIAPGRLDVRGARCLDAGASTGGFTEVLLERGAEHVVAVDVGHGQLGDRLRADGRVTVVEGCNVRDHEALRSAVAGAAPSVVVADLSFISLTLVVEPLLRVARPGADLLLMVKPQFEVGRSRLGGGGVVTDVRQQAEAVVGVVRACEAAGGAVLAVLPSVLPGESGNREFFLWVRSAAAPADGVAEAARRAVLTGGPVLVGSAEAAR